MTGVTTHGIRHPDGASRAKNLGPELQQMAEDIDELIYERRDPIAKSVVRCIRREAGKWVWVGPDAPTATHYLIPDHTGALVVRATPLPTPLASPALDW